MANGEDIKQIKLPLETALYSKPIPVTQDNEYLLQYRLATEDLSKTSAWSQTYTIPGNTLVAYNTTATIDSVANTISWTDDNEIKTGLYDIYTIRRDNNFDASDTYRFYPVSKVIAGANYDAVIRAEKPHGLAPGMNIKVESMITEFNTTAAVITAVTEFTITYNGGMNTDVTFTPNVSDANAKITILSAATTDGIPFSYYEYYGTTTYTNNVPISTSVNITDSVTGKVFTSTANFCWFVIQKGSTSREVVEDLLIAQGAGAI